MSRTISCGRARVPVALVRHSPGGADRFQKALVDRLDHPVGGALRGNRPNIASLAAQDAQVTDAVPTIGDRNGQVAQDDPRVVG